MLIIFDLDDTLIDTSGTIVPQRLNFAFKKMVDSGLCFERPEGQMEKLFQINKEAISAKEALKEFLSGHNAIEKYFEIGLNAIYNEFDPSIKVSSRKGAIKILNELKKSHELALVTIGKDEFQRIKLKNAGIDFSLFSIINVIDCEDKKPFYKKIIGSLEKKASETLVCGDKIHTDLKPAKELNCITVHMRYGRGASDRNKGFESFVDYNIEELEELKGIINKIGG